MCAWLGAEEEDGAPSEDRLLFKVSVARTEARLLGTREGLHLAMGWWLGTRGIFRHSDMMQILLISLPQVTAHINRLAVLVPLPPEPA